MFTQSTKNISDKKKKQVKHKQFFYFYKLNKKLLLQSELEHEPTEKKVGSVTLV